MSSSDPDRKHATRKDNDVNQALNEGQLSMPRGGTPLAYRLLLMPHAKLLPNQASTSMCCGEARHVNTKHQQLYAFVSEQLLLIRVLIALV
jgi:hypothetical protein